MGARVGRTVSAVSRTRNSVPKRQTVRDPATDAALDSEVNTANEKLLDNLKSVYVESTDIVSKSSKPNDKLPKERSSPVHDPLDMVEPVEGYLLVKQVIQVLDYQRANQLDKVDAGMLAKQYKMDQKDIENLLKYFGNYYVRPDANDKYELKYHLLHR